MAKSVKFAWARQLPSRTWLWQAVFQKLNDNTKSGVVIE